MYRIMLVEDEPPILRSIGEIIQSSDPEFKIVGMYENGEEALLELELVKPHVILTDIQMPIMNGLELIKRVREINPAIECAILTGFQDFEYARTAVQMGVRDYLLKPPTSDNVMTFLSQLKSKLQDTQITAETEWFMQMINGEKSINSEEMKIINELFYFPEYELIYFWCPPAFELPKAMIRNLLESYRVKYYMSGGLMHNELIGVIGGYQINEAQLKLWAEALSAELHASPVSIVLSTIKNLPHQLKKEIKTAHQIAERINLLDRCVVYGYDLHQPLQDKFLSDKLIRQSVQLFKSGSRSHFRQHIEHILEVLYDGDYTRMQLKQAFTHLLYQLQPKGEQSEFLLVLEREIEEAIMNNRSIAGLQEELTSIFAGFMTYKDGDEPTQWVDEMKNYIDVHFTESLSLASLSDTFHLNPSYLCRIFKRQTGISPIEYQIRLRIQEAKALIQSKPRLMFKQVAEMVGYRDVYHFSKIFKQYTGKSPTEFKRELNI